MTELEKIERAKMYMDKLANGIDPISDKEASEGDVINNVRLSRCFFFISDVLRQILDNGGITVQKKSKKAKAIPFSLSFEKRKKFEYSDNPISISEISRRINALSENENMSRLTYGKITGWLIKIGMLELSATAVGRHTKLPTEAGLELGISTELRTGMKGDYTAVLYNKQAQQFIIDNVDAISEHQTETAK